MAQGPVTAATVTVLQDVGDLTPNSVWSVSAGKAPASSGHHANLCFISRLLQLLPHGLLRFYLT